MNNIFNWWGELQPDEQQTLSDKYYPDKDFGALSRSYDEIQNIYMKEKVIHGTYVENPKCMFCGCDVSHECLAGDYTLLICDKSVCLDKLNNRAKYDFKYIDMIKFASFCSGKDTKEIDIMLYKWVEDNYSK